MPVFVLDANREPLTPCHDAVARKLLKAGKAAVLRRLPCTIILKRVVVEPNAEPLRVKIDPGSRVSGIVLVNDRTGEVPFAAEIEHRGRRIKAAMDDRRAHRRNRRSRKTRHRPARFENRIRPKGWLPPSLESRIANVETWLQRLRQFAPIGAISMELVKFDTQLLQNPEISGVEYQQGTLNDYECREYLLEKWHRRCAYCGAENVPLQVEHILAKDRGGTDRVSNLTLACRPCNQAKGNRRVEEFLVNKPDVLKRVLTQAKAPLKDAAATNATRWELFRRLSATRLPLEIGTGGRTKFNRTQHGLPKAHWIDAVCVGASTPEILSVDGIQPQAVRAMGHGCRQRCNPDRFGFPRSHKTRTKKLFGFQTGDLVRAVITKGKDIGAHVGRAAVRKSGEFEVGKLKSVRWKRCGLLQHADGYDYGRA